MKLNDFLQAFKTYYSQVINFDVRNAGGVTSKEFTNHEIILQDFKDNDIIEEFYIDDWEPKDPTTIIIYLK